MYLGDREKERATALFDDWEVHTQEENTPHRPCRNRTYQQMMGPLVKTSFATSIFIVTPSQPSQPFRTSGGVGLLRTDLRSGPF